MDDVSDYLVNPQDLNHTVALAGQVFRDQVEAQLADNIIDIMNMLGLIPEDDDAFLQVVEIVGNRIDKIKRRAKVSNFGEAKPQKTPQKKKKLFTKIKRIEKKRKRKKLIKTIKKKKNIKNLKGKNMPPQKRP
jgi:hypothetical protein